MDALGDAAVVSHDHAPFSRRHHLSGIEAKGSGDSEGARADSAKGRSVRMSGIFHEPESIPLGQLHQLRHTAGHDTSDMHDDKPRSSGCECGCHIYGTYTEGFRIHVYEDRISTGVHDCCRCGKESVGRDQNILSLDLEGAKDDFERTGAAADGDGMANAAEARELLLKLRSVFAQRQMARRQYLLDALGNPGPVFGQELYLRCRHLDRTGFHFIHRFFGSSRLRGGSCAQSTTKTRRREESRRKAKYVIS